MVFTTMRFIVAQLLKEPVGEHRSYAFDEALEMDDDIRLTEAVRGSVKLTRLNQGLLADAHATTALELECSRCLDVFEAPIAVTFEECFVPTVDIHTGLPYRAHELDPVDVFHIDDHHMVDLSEPMRQHIVLAIPMMPLHAPDCPGLCPVCGINLTFHPGHAHTEVVVDERLQALRTLIDQSSSTP